MSTYLGKLAVGGIESQVTREVSNTFSTVSGAFSVSGSRRTDPPGIDWTNFNYPPFLRIIHYDVSELPTVVATVCRIVNASFLVAGIALITNFVHTCILVIGGANGITVLYSLLNFLIFLPAFGYTFFQGYRALALSSPSYTSRYLIFQGVMICLAMLFAFVPLGCINGFGRLAGLPKQTVKLGMSEGMRVYWSIIIVVESILWLTVAGLGLCSFIKVWIFNPYHSQQSRSAGITIP